MPRVRHGPASRVAGSQTLGPLGIKADVDLDLDAAWSNAGSSCGASHRSGSTIPGRDCPELVLVQGDTTTVLCAARRVLSPNSAGACRGRLANRQSGKPLARRGESDSLLATRHAALRSDRSGALEPACRRRPDKNNFRHGQHGSRRSASALATTEPRSAAANCWAGNLDGSQQFQPAGADHRAPARKLRAGVGVDLPGHREIEPGVSADTVCVSRASQSAGPSARCRKDFAVPASSANVHLLEPLAYLAVRGCLSRATLVLTDSGGVQEEAPSLGKPVLVMRDTTERPEGLAAGTGALVGTDAATIVAEVSRLLTDAPAYEAMARVHHLLWRWTGRSGASPTYLRNSSFAAERDRVRCPSMSRLLAETCMNASNENTLCLLIQSSSAVRCASSLAQVRNWSMRVPLKVGGPSFRGSFVPEGEA